MDLLADVRGDTDTVWWRERLETGGDIDAIPGHVAAINDDVSDVDADAKPNPGFDAPVGLERYHAALDADAALQGRGGAGERGQKAVPGRLDQAAAVLFNLGLRDFFAQLAQSRKGQRFVALHQPAGADHVGNHDRRQLPFSCFYSHNRLPYQPDLKPSRTASRSMSFELNGSRPRLTHRGARACAASAS